MSDLIPIGAIAGAYGVRGELRVKSYCAVPEDIESYSPLYSEDGETQYVLAILRPIKNGFAARIPQVATKEDADAHTCLFRSDSRSVDAHGPAGEPVQVLPSRRQEAGGHVALGALPR